MSRIKRYTIRSLLVLVAMVAIGIGFFAVRNWLAGRRVESKLAAIRDNHQPVVLADLERQSIPPDKNAITYLRRAREGVEALQAEWQPLYDNPVVATLLSENHPNDQSLQVIAASFAAYPSVIPLLEKAARCPDYDSQLDCSVTSNEFLQNLMKHVQFQRQVARTLRFWALLQAARGNPDSSIDACTWMLRLARHFDSDPMIVARFVGIACRSLAIETANSILQCYTTSAATRAALRDELQMHESNDPFKHTLVTERAFGITYLQELPGQVSFTASLTEGYLDVLETQIAHANSVYGDKTAEEATSQAFHSASTFGLLLMPAIQAWRDAEFRARAEARCLLVLLALQEHPKTGDETALQMESLGLPAQVTADPFDDGRLHVKKVAGGWLVYSVGKDLKDDGGVFVNREDVGLGPSCLSTKASK